MRFFAAVRRRDFLLCLPAPEMPGHIKNSLTGYNLTKKKKQKKSAGKCFRKPSETIE
ncbi:hypothetical protein CLS_29100 [[Clostridium] cf. saccharolyticum K10]|nr:hypothetical protein CLS_29100 [[Clostridium] cf. saccharolyticum K10]